MTKKFLNRNHFPFHPVKNRTLHLIITNVVQLLLFVASAVTAFLLRFDFNIPPKQLRNVAVGLAVWVPVKLLLFHRLRLDRRAWRFVSLFDMRSLVWAQFISCAVSAVMIILISPDRFPHSLYLLDFLLSVLFTGGARLVFRILSESSHTATAHANEAAFIYGAGAAGIMLLREIGTNPSSGYKLSGFIDDDPAKQGMLIHGIPVLGSGSDLPKLAAKHGIKTILIAIPSATGSEMMTILAHCADSQLRFRTVPSLSDMVNGVPNRQVLRDVAVEDLLNRTPVQIEQGVVEEKLSGQVVLVTGAAGSIGSELIRQIARFRPKLLIGLDAAETPLFHIEREIRQTFPGLIFEPIIANIRDSERLDEIFAAFRPQLVFHAAAYKHVPMMEAHIFEAVENNILGTYNVAKAAARARVREFVMVSSDKAVKPTSIMGLTKRVSELIVSSIENGGGTFVSVRFGNVLGSNGSVIPIFREQIAAGGPVTVTHPDMRRFFMTIPEAAQLVLQASSMGKGSEIFVLDMGEPVRIVDLAKNLILLSGLRPEQDIPIVFTGSRPGEKLYEEVSSYEEKTCATYHEKIRIFSGMGHIPNLENWIEMTRRLCRTKDMRIVLSLKELVSDYNPSANVLRHLLKRDEAVRPEIAPEKTLSLSAGS